MVFLSRTNVFKFSLNSQNKQECVQVRPVQYTAGVSLSVPRHVVALADSDIRCYLGKLRRRPSSVRCQEL